MYKTDNFKNAWDFVFKYLYYDKTGLIYDARMTCNAENGMIVDLPTPGEIADEMPNPCGWGSGMEDSVLNNSSMLEAVILRYEATGEAEMRTLAKNLFRGLLLCADAAESEGFLARSVSPVDGKSHFKNSSRDQYTHWVYAAWKYYHSPLSSEKEKADIRRVLNGFARRCDKYMKPEYRFNMRREDGKYAAVCDMWGDTLSAHEFMRLPMIYAAAWDTTGDEHWFAKYMEYRDEALEKSAALSDNYSVAYALLQMQYSLDLVYRADKDESFKAACAEIMDKVAKRCTGYAPRYAAEFDDTAKTGLCALDTPWRERKFIYLKPQNEDDHGMCFPCNEEFCEKAHFPLRNSAEALIVQALNPLNSVPAEQIEALCFINDGADYDRNMTYAAVLMADAYWMLKNKGML